jgi:S1-C subfamily serine protease
MDNVFVLYDRATHSVWYPGETGLEAVAGSRKGSSIPFLDKPAPIALAAWLEQQPASTVLLPSEEDHASLEEMRNRPYLGVRLGEQDGTLVIDEVMPDTAADAAGFEAGDVIVKIGEHSIASREDLSEALGDHGPGDTVAIAIERDGSAKTVETTLGHRE